MYRPDQPRSLRTDLRGVRGKLSTGSGGMRIGGHGLRALATINAPYYPTFGGTTGLDTHRKEGVLWHCRSGGRQLKLYQLAYCCRLYDRFTNYDASIAKLRDGSPATDLDRQQDALAVLGWLRDWGCRHLAIRHDSTNAMGLATWSRRWRAALPSTESSLSELEPAVLERVADAYAELSALHA